MNADPYERLENQKIEIERLRDCLRDCADELEAQLDVRHVHRDRYPTIMRDYERDMEPVKRARALLPSTNERNRT